MTPDVEKVAVRAFAAAIMAYLEWPEPESRTMAAELIRKAAEAAERRGHDPDWTAFRVVARESHRLRRLSSM